MNLSKIKDIAKDQGKTLGSVAAAVGITHAGLNTLMKENSTRVDTLLKIANYLGVSITEFFDEEDMHTSAPVYGNTATVGDRFRGQLQVGTDSNITRALDILEGQLKAKDEQISGLIKALNR
jgi:transcriptional regulator with XRE-family HTH domain